MISIYPIVMTRAGGIMGSRQDRVPAYLADIPNDRVETIRLNDAGDDWEAASYPCWTFFVDSRTGDTGDGPDESGDGSAGNPWRNLNSALQHAGIQCLIGQTCCCYVRVVVSGRIDYHVSGGAFDFDQRLVLEFQDDCVVAIRGDRLKALFQDFIGVAFKRARVSHTGDFPKGGNFAVFYNCRFCVFNDVAISASLTASAGVTWAAISGAYNSLFCRCSIIADGKTLKPGHDGMTVRGITGAGSANLFDCSVNVRAVGATDDYSCYAYGISSSENASFRRCRSKSHATAEQNHIGNHDAVFSFAFSENSRSIFIECEGVSTASMQYHALNGWDLCLACGFYRNNNSVFTDCSGSPQICGYGPYAPSGGADCSNFSCDI